MRFEQETSVYKDEVIQSRITAASDAAYAAQTSADGKNTVYYAASAPSGLDFADGDVWFDTGSDNAIYLWNGQSEQWTKQELGANAIADLSITNAKIANSTIQNAKIANLDGGKITAGSINALQLAAGSVNAEKLAIGDFTNYATVNELYPASMNTTAGTETAIDSTTGMVVKASATQEYLPLVIASGANPFHSGDEVRYSLNIKSDAAGDVLLRIIGFNASDTWICENAVTLSLTTSVQTLSGVITLSSPLFDSAAYYRIAIRDTRSNKSQIYFSQAQFYRRLSGDLIVDGAITTDKIAAGAVTADMITAGTMSADRINGGTLTLGGANNAHGVLNIQDASGNNVGTWNNGGLTNATKLETKNGDQILINIANGKKTQTEGTGESRRIRIHPQGLASISADGSSYVSQIRQAKFSGTKYGGADLSTYGWYIIPSIFTHEVYADDGQLVGTDTIDALHQSLVGLINRCMPKFDFFERITDWNTTYTAGTTPVIKLYYSLNASNAPMTGSRHYIGFELNYNQYHRMQMAMHTNASGSNNLYVRHTKTDDGVWLGWGQITAAAPAT